MIDTGDIHDSEKCADCAHPRFEHITLSRVTAEDNVQHVAAVIGLCTAADTRYGFGYPEEGRQVPCQCYGFRESRPRVPAWRLSGRPYDPQRVRR